MGDTILTFQISNALQIPFEDNKSFADSSPAWDGPATDRFIRMRYGHNETSLTGESQQHIVTPSTKDHRGILVSLLLAGFVLMGVMVLSVFEYLNYLNRSTPDRTLGNFCSALKKKEYQSVHDQLSNKLHKLGTEKMIASNLSNVKGCTYKLSEEAQYFAVAKISFTGLSGQLVSGKLMLVKDSNDAWKIDDLQIFK